MILTMRKVFWKSITGLSILLALSAFHVQNAASQETLLREYVNFFEHKIASGKVSTSHTKFYQTDGKKFYFHNGLSTQTGRKNDGTEAVYTDN